jgi:hypothetical protein
MAAAKLRETFGHVVTASIPESESTLAVGKTAPKVTRKCATPQHVNRASQTSVELKIIGPLRTQRAAA